MRILITGICGFVGSRLAFGLRRRIPSASISGIDSLARRGSQTSLATLADADIRVVHGDVRCASDFEGLGDCDWVIDAAANPSVLAGVDGRTSSRQLVEHNLLGTVNILEFCRRRGAGLVLLSTSRVYSVGSLRSLPLVVRDEAFVPDPDSPWPSGASPEGIAEPFSTAAPVSLYGGTKLASEVLALEYRDLAGLPVIVDRCGVIAGPGQFGTAEQGIFSYWVGSWAARRRLAYIGFDGTGHQVRDALHPDDLASLLHLQMQRGLEASGIWNVGGGSSHAMSLAQLSRWCRDTLGDHQVAVDSEPRRWDIPWLVMDSRRVRSSFGWQPARSMHEMLQELAAFYTAHPEWLDLSRH